MWFDKSGLAWSTITIATIWWTVGFNMILFIAGLQDIPSSIYEASSIDGASKVQQFLYITMPSLSGVMKMVILLQIISSFKLFGQSWLMTGGGPGNSTTPMVTIFMRRVLEIGIPVMRQRYPIPCCLL